MSISARFPLDFRRFHPSIRFSIRLRFRLDTVHYSIRFRRFRISDPKFLPDVFPETQAHALVIFLAIGSFIPE
jgi:hypothetical protein